MSWEKKSADSKTWNKYSNSTNSWNAKSDSVATWTSKSNEVSEWIIGRMRRIIQNLFKHRLHFGTYILGTLIYNGKLQNWTKSNKTENYWQGKDVSNKSWVSPSKSGDWQKKEIDSDLWDKVSNKSGEWEKK